MRYEPRCQHKNGYDCEICDKSYEDYKLNYGNQKEVKAETLRDSILRRKKEHNRRMTRCKDCCLEWGGEGLDPEWYKE
jgi:hypothetical protein